MANIKNIKISFFATKKLILILSLGLPLMIVSSIYFPTLTVILFIIFNSIVIGLAIVDYFISPKENDIDIFRDKNSRLYYKSINKVTIRVKNKFNKQILIQLKDQIPSRHFIIVNTNLKNLVPQNSESVFEFHLFPNKRGNFKSDIIYAKVTGVLGLCCKYFIYDNPIEYKVYPNLEDLSKYKLMVNKNMLSVNNEKRVSKRGFGSDFESLREYVDGDDYKKINWLATARENKLIVNQYDQDKNNPIFIMIDTGRALSYETGGYKKLDYAINAALILADIINQKGDNCGVLTFDTDVNSFIMAKKGFNHRNNLMETLYTVKDKKETSNYEKVFKAFNTKQKRKSMVFIFTDFHTLDEAKDFISLIPIISKKHMPIVILMKNELAEQRALSKDNAMELDSIFLKGVSIDFILERKKIIESINRHGVVCVESSSENFALSAVNNYINMKNML